MERVDHWSGQTHDADAMRQQTAAYENALRQELGLTEATETIETTETAPALPVSSELEDAKRVVAEKEAQIDKLCAEIEAMEQPVGPFAGRRIAISVAKAHGIKFREMISSRRTRNLAWARQHAMWEMKRHTKLSLPQIGLILGDRDHTTVLHGIRAHQKRIDSGEIR